MIRLHYVLACVAAVMAASVWADDATTKPATPPGNADDCLLWKTQLPDGENHKCFLVGNMAVVYNEGDGKLHAYTLADGTKTWEFQTGHDRSEPLNMGAIGNLLIGHVYVRDGDSKKFLWQMVTLDSATGEVLRRGEPGNHYITSGGEKLFVNNRIDRQISRLSPKDNKVLWTLDWPSAIDGEPEITSLSLRIIKDLCLINAWHAPDVASRRWRKLLVVETESGNILWELSTPDSNVAHVENTVVGERLYVRLHNDHAMEYLPLKVYELKSGKKLEMTEPRQKEWERANHYDLKTWETTITVLGDRIVRYGTHTLEAYDLATGKRVWKHMMTEMKGEDDDDLQFDIPLEERVKKLEAAIEKAKKNEGKWMTLLYARIRDVWLVEHDGAVLLAVEDGLLALDLTTGKPLWKFPMDHVITRGPFVRNGIAYFMTDDGTIPRGSIYRTPNRLLYALDLSKAKLLGSPEGETVEMGEDEPIETAE